MGVRCSQIDHERALCQQLLLYKVQRRDRRALNFPPNTNFAYSNTNYVLLAQVVGRLSKQTFRSSRNRDSSNRWECVALGSRSTAWVLLLLSR